MATIVNNPTSDNASSGMGLVVGFLLLLFVALFFLFYGLPFLRGNAATTGGTQVNLPSKVNVQTK